MSVPYAAPSGDPAREAIDSLRGYVYQIYQSALAWTEINDDELLYLEVAEDFAVLASKALEAVQVKAVSRHVTINSNDIITSIDSFIELTEKNSNLNVTLRHLTTSIIGKERKPEHRIGETPTLVMWRNLAKAGELSGLRKILKNSKLSGKSKKYIEAFSDTDFRENFLKKIHFDCGAPDLQFLEAQIRSRVSNLVMKRGGTYSQGASCTDKILLYLLKLSTNKNRNERYVNRAVLEEQIEATTHIVISRERFETQNLLVERALSASLSGDARLSTSQSIKLSPVLDVPLPSALANRNEDVAELLRHLERTGICWICGAAGMGKSVAARILAHKNEGVWASINLKGQSGEQVVLALSEAANTLSSFGLRGLIVDDLDYSLGSTVLDNLHYLFYSASRADVLLVVVSSSPPTSDFLFTSGLKVNIVTTLVEFTEKNIREILEKLKVESTGWTKYIHLVSGGGHPQLVIAFIQSMVTTGWDSKELQTLNSLLTGSQAVDEVRKHTRERLLMDLSGTARRLIERISLTLGGFSRELVIDLGKVEPLIQDAGIILDSLTGSWIDQHEGDRFSLSPLLSGYAARTLATDEKGMIQSAIADSLTKGSQLNVIDMNSAFVAAWASNNKSAIIKMCMTILGTDQDELEMLSPHLSMFTVFRVDVIAYPSDAGTSHMFRGVQLLLLNQESNSFTQLKDLLRCFFKEAGNVQDEEIRATTNLLVYSRLLHQTAKGGLGVNFIDVIQALDQLLLNDNCAIRPEVLEHLNGPQEGGVTPIGFMFLNQVRQLCKIKDLSVVFDFLDSSSFELRSRLLEPFGLDDFEVDILVAGAWLSEHKNNTIDSHTHSVIFACLEKQAVRWDHTDLAVCCRKYQAIILDEYGDDKESALVILDEGLIAYGQTNSELVRAKARVLYRSEDHEGSLAISKTLIESDACLNEVEKAFLGRDAAISAEKQGDLNAARRYYLYGSDAASKSGVPDMAAMRVGLLADAALVSWHDNDRIICLKEFATVLSELSKFAPDETLRTSHCHAVTRHILLWMYKNAVGGADLENCEEVRIYPGCVSNPEPHQNIGQHYIVPIEMSWYMLAAIEVYASFDAGIAENLEKLLPSGPVLQGQMILIPAKTHKAMARLDVKLFIDALTETISQFAFMQVNGNRHLGIKQVTYGLFPLASKEQQYNFSSLTEQYILLYFSMCILKEGIVSTTEALQELTSASGFVLRPALIKCLEGGGLAEDFNTGFALLISVHVNGLSQPQAVSPRQVFELALNVLQLAQSTPNYRLFSESTLLWLKSRWHFIWAHQRFSLIYPLMHKATIDAAINQGETAPQVKTVGILSAILPVLGISNQEELEKILSNLPQ